MAQNSGGHIPFWRDSRNRSIALQVLALGLILGSGYFLLHNATTALTQQGASFGFDLFNQEAAFAISESFISYSPENSFWRAFAVGLLNTLWVVVLGNFFAVLWGTLMGISQLSPNWLLAKLAQSYVNWTRNIPLLLQLLFWYSLLTETLPPVHQAIKIAPASYLSQRGLAIPTILPHPAHSTMLVALALGLMAVGILYRWQKIRQQKTGKTFAFFPAALALTALPPLLAWMAGGAPTALSSPQLQGFNFSGGTVISPEFSALLFGLVLYTGAFIAEIVRSGIQSVGKGQWEAAASLGLSPGKTLRLVILPQALRVIIPPLTSQMLNLTKNSSLAVAIGYSDFVSIANTVMNQTGKSIECIALIMAIFLTFSLLTSLLMNGYNHMTRMVSR